MRVKVLPRDIENGMRVSCTDCPIARAVKRAVKHTRVRVMSNHVTVGARYYPLPAVARRFVDRFDMGRPVKPITFSCQPKP